MIEALRNVAKVAYYLGLLSVVIAVLVRFVPAIAGPLAVTPRGVMTFAVALFLCTLASQVVARWDG